MGGVTGRSLGRPTRAIIASIVAMGLYGCALHEQVQYFEVVDPDTRHVNYYRMTIAGHGGAGVSYELQAGYFSAASVDVLRGQIPAMPEADLPAGQDAAYDRLVQGYYDALAEAGNRPASADAPAGSDADALARARLVWLGSLSPADVASMGMSGSANPFTFRKLVFWATAKNVDLRQFGTEIDSMIGGATSLVRAHKASHANRAARQAGWRQFVGELARSNRALRPYAEAIQRLIGAEGASDEDAKK